MRPVPVQSTHRAPRVSGAGAESESGRAGMIAGFWEKAGGWLLPRDAQGEGYWELARTRAPQVGFCLLFVFASGIGQTFLLSIFQPHWMRELGVSSTQMGALYGGATLASGLVLSWTGRWLDSLPARRTGLLVLTGLAVFSAGAACVSTPWMLAAVLFGLRFFGQGLSSNVGMTCAARWFSHNRGKAVTLARLGFPLGEAVLPGLVTFSLVALGWRWTWGALAGVAVLLMPVASALIARHPAADLDCEAAESAPCPGGTRRALRHDPRFYAMLAVTSPLPFIATGLIFFQGALAEERGWNPAVFATGFVIFAVVRAACSLSAGSWVDRIGAMRLLPLPAVTLGLGLACLARPEPVWAYLFFCGMGVSFGSSGAIATAAWTEMFGTAKIGSIRALSSSVSVFVTAAAPAAFGLALGHGVSVQTLVLGSAALMLGVAWPLSVALRRVHRG